VAHFREKVAPFLMEIDTRGSGDGARQQRRRRAAPAAARGGIHSAANLLPLP
jgi:hypothetical protein